MGRSEEHAWEGYRVPVGSGDFGDGSTMPIIDTAVGRVGAAICWENYMPLYRTAM